MVVCSQVAEEPEARAFHPPSVLCILRDDPVQLRHEAHSVAFTRKRCVILLMEPVDEHQQHAEADKWVLVEQIDVFHHIEHPSIVVVCEDRPGLSAELRPGVAVSRPREVVPSCALPSCARRCTAAGCLPF